MLHTINSINLNWTVGWQLFAKYLIINDNRINYGDTLLVGPHSRSDGKDFRMPNVHGWFSTTLKVLVSVCLHFSETSQANSPQHSLPTKSKLDIHWLAACALYMLLKFLLSYHLATNYDNEIGLTCSC